MNKIYIVGMGPGFESMMTKQAIDALEASDVIVGYTVYIKLLGEKFQTKELLTTPMLQLEKKEQESLEKAKQYAAQKRELKKRQKDVETKKRTHRLCQIGGAVESVLGSAIEEDDIPKLIGFLKRQEANGKFFSKAMQKEPVANTEEV